MKFLPYLIILYFITNSAILHSQEEAVQDTSLSLTIKEKKDNSGIDSVVTMSATDSVVFDAETRIMRLKGDSKINYKTQKINAEIIEISFENAMMDAYGLEDSTGVIKGFPVFNDFGEEFAGKRIRFNFKTSKGIISMGETELSEGFYYGSKIKKIDETSFFVEEGRYTTCDAPEPHYYFGSPEMKIQAGNKVYLDPLILYVEDVPVFMLPFGLFFPNTSGRQSGLIVPTFYFSRSRGVVLQDFGFYWAASDYWDTQLRANFYSKGGYLLKNESIFKYRDLISGNLLLEYGKNKLSYDDPYNTNWSVAGRYNHIINPYERVNADFNFASGNFFRNTQTDNRERITQNITSRVSYNKSFSNNSSLSASYSRNQNIITGEYSQNLPLTWNLPSFKALNDVEFLPDWLQDTRFSYSLTGNYSDSRRLEINTIEVSDDSSYIDSSFVYGAQRRIEHRPSISVSPKLGYFTLNPSINFSVNNYFRRVNRSFNQEDSTITDNYETGLFTEYNYGLSLGLSTKIYGLIDNKHPILFFIKPEMIGVKAFRHTYRPNFSIRYNPDLSDPGLGFYGTYYDEEINQEVTYSRYILDGGGLASRRKSFSLNYSDQHVFEMKIAQGDTLEDKNLELLNVGFNTGYNFAADSLHFSDISVSFRTPAIKFLQFSGSASFTLYDEEYTNVVDPFTGRVTTGFRKIDQFLAANGKGLVRMTNFAINASTSFSSEGVSLESQFGEDVDENEEEKEEESKLGQRFRLRNDVEEKKHTFGDNIPGFTPFNIPWNVNLSVNYNYGMANQSEYARNESLFLRARLNFSLTSTLDIATSSGFDLLTGEIRTPNIDLIKDLHCWRLVFNWVPTGFNRGFYLRFGIKASHLSDLKIEKEDNPLLR